MNYKYVLWSILLLLKTPVISQSKVGFSHEIGMNYLVADWDDNTCLMYSPGLYLRMNQDNAITLKFNISASGFQDENPLVIDMLRVRDTPFFLGYHWGSGSSINSERTLGFHMGIGISNYNYLRVRDDHGISQPTRESHTVISPCMELGLNTALFNFGIYTIMPNSNTKLILGFYLRGGPFFIGDIIKSMK